MILNIHNPINADNPLNDGLVARWQVLPNWCGGNTFRDLTGRYDGTLVGGALPTWTGDRGRGGFGALDFRVDDSRVSIPQAVVTTPPFTFAAWVRLDSKADHRRILGVTIGGSPGDHMDIFFEHSQRVFSLFYNNVVDTLYGTINPVLGRWYFVVGVYSAIRELYVDGVLDAVDLTFVADATGLDTTVIGALDWGGGIIQEWDGLIDDCRIWDRALSSSEVRQVYRDSQKRFDPTLNWIRTPRGVVVPGGPAGPVAADLYPGAASAIRLGPGSVSATRLGPAAGTVSRQGPGGATVSPRGSS